MIKIKNFVYINKYGGALDDLYWGFSDENWWLTEIIFSVISVMLVFKTSVEKSIVLVFILKWKAEQSDCECVSKWISFWYLQTECSCFSKECTNCTAKGSSIVVTRTMEIICLKIFFIIF